MSIRMVHNDDGLDEIHEINVTPFIDVMLVLLIIFMVAAPLTTVDVPVDLPVSTAAPPPVHVDPIYLTLQSDLSVSVGERKTPAAMLPQALDAASRGGKTVRIFVRADHQVEYGHVVALLNILQQQGFLKVALVGVEPGDGPDEALK